MEETREKFLALRTREDVANLLGIKEKSIRYFLYVIKPDNMYYEFEVPKKVVEKELFVLQIKDSRIYNENWLIS